MKSGFLISDDPAVSKLSVTKSGNDATLGKRKYRFEDFELERNIGCGNFSQIWHVTLKARPQESYALKIVNVQERNAMLLLNSPGHPNVIRMIDTFRDNDNVYLLYEYAKGGELWEEIKNVGVQDKYVSRVMVGQLLNGIEYIHNRGIVHRDLKCENVVIDGGVLKIIDFGTSKFVEQRDVMEQNDEAYNECRDATSRSIIEKNEMRGNNGSISLHRGAMMRKKFKHYVGTPNFMPPEAISNISSDYAGDLWSFGCTIYQLLLGFNCFTGSSNYFIYKRIKINQIGFPANFDPDAMDLIKQLLRTNPQERLSLAKVREHKFFTAIRDLVPPVVSLETLKTVDTELRRACNEAQELIYNLTVKRENATEVDHKEIKDAISCIEQHDVPGISDAINFNYVRTQEQLALEIDEANLYMAERLPNDR
ncbi:protein kinase domain containing protein, putative [Babesia bigemina]|uniref:Protein kinase domain containing protein, putative n=1 Tax=Babesia bigemina TaxID=5866 RepID=A0A061D6P5_BABBI|nr:protein kinase domain containing protein, putative [Babesia bigemina]CDR96223.1 protein kinase domain containing protein, putative [Babesia bigemina]|eukprot:XP_012768409.1 protein kinase domain containing protein, putative [Babesia bigemina]